MVQFRRIGEMNSVNNYKCLVCHCISIKSLDKRLRYLACENAPGENEKH